MTLQQLKYLLSIVEHGSMLKASRALDVTQPTLSAMLRKLESELEVSIFDRSSQNLKLTEIGECIINQAKVVLNTADNLKELVHEKKNLIGGKLRLGVIPTVASYFVPDFINTFHKTHTEVELSVIEMKTSDIIEALSNAEIDMAVLATPLNVPSLLEIPLYYERFWAYVSPELKEIYNKETLTASDLPLESLWVLAEGHCLTQQIFNFCGEEEKIKNIYTAGNIGTLVRTVDRVGGCTVVPSLDIANLTEEQKKNIRPIENPIGVREISLVVKDDFVREKLLNDVVNSVKQFIPSEMIDERLKKFAVRL
ncbi:MAG: LysR family transcriptional regulator [Bacteroidales bacterium]|jgi:LysR family hydrogen peroxide-inducible transcriptional activator|nr:LysR family transcriptional regulator [Bacteroidales bacterium]